MDKWIKEAKMTFRIGNRRSGRETPNKRPLDMDLYSYLGGIFCGGIAAVFTR